MKRKAEPTVLASDSEEPPARQIIPVIGDSAVHVGRGLLKHIASELLANKGIKASRFIIVSDTNVWPLYGQQLC